MGQGQEVHARKLISQFMHTVRYQSLLVFVLCLQLCYIGFVVYLNLLRYGCKEGRVSFSICPKIQKMFKSHKNTHTPS